MPELIEVHALHYDKGSSDKVWAYMVTHEANMMFDWRAVWGKRTGPKMSKTMSKGKSLAGAGETAAKAYAAKRREGYTAIGNLWRDPKWGLANYIDGLVASDNDDVVASVLLAISQKQGAWASAGRPEHVFTEGTLKPGFCDICAFIREGHIATVETCDFCILSDTYTASYVQNTAMKCACGHDWYSGHGMRGVQGSSLEHKHTCLVSKCICPHFVLPAAGQVMLPKTPTRKTKPAIAVPPAPAIILPPPRRTPRSISHLLSDDL